MGLPRSKNIEPELQLSLFPEKAGPAKYELFEIESSQVRENPYSYLLSLGKELSREERIKRLLADLGVKMDQKWS